MNKLITRKLTTYFICTLMGCASLSAQVGINSKTPLSIFYIDGQGNNPSTGTPSALQQLDDFVVKSDDKGGVNVGIGTIPSALNNTQLELGSPNRAFVYNRVALTSVLDKTTVLNPTEGMMVLNTATAGAYPDNVVPGLYYFNGQAWFRIETKDYNGMTLRMRDLEENLESTLITSDPALPPVGALPLNFGNDIVIDRTGGFAFSLRLYGRVLYLAASSEMEKTDFYIYLIRKDGITSAETVESYVRINVPTYSSSVGVGAAGSNAMTYTVTLGCSANVGDKIIFKLGYRANLQWVLYAAPLKAAKTSLIYWKI